MAELMHHRGEDSAAGRTNGAERTFACCCSAPSPSPSPSQPRSPRTGLALTAMQPSPVHRQSLPRQLRWFLTAYSRERLPKTQQPTHQPKKMRNTG